MMTEHRVKSWPEYFEPVYIGEKSFELRRNDRDYQIGDTLVLCEWEPELPTRRGFYTGRECKRRIRYVFEAHADPNTMKRLPPNWGLEPGYCILGLEWKQ